jgi:hypothetical protein
MMAGGPAFPGRLPLNPPGPAKGPHSMASPPTPLPNLSRCLLMPGSTLGRSVVLGSGCYGPRDFEFPPGSTWVGVQQKPTEAMEPVRF